MRGAFLARVTPVRRVVRLARERALSLMIKRADERETFGKHLARHQMIQAFLADSAIDLALRG